MKKNISIKRTVITSYISSMLVILISIHIVIIVVFLNWENRRIKSEINKTTLVIHKELKVIKHLNEASTIKLLHKKIAEFAITQGTQPSLHINLIYKGISFSSESIKPIQDYKTELGEFQFIIINRNILIIKNLLLKLGGQELYIQIYSDSEEIKGDLRSLLNSLFFSSIFILIISLGVVRKIDKIIQSPIQEITKTAKKNK